MTCCWKNGCASGSVVTWLTDEREAIRESRTSMIIIISERDGKYESKKYATSFSDYMQARRREKRIVISAFTWWIKFHAIIDIELDWYYDKMSIRNLPFPEINRNQRWKIVAVSQGFFFSQFIVAIVICTLSFNQSVINHRGVVSDYNYYVRRTAR